MDLYITNHLSLLGFNHIRCFYFLFYKFNKKILKSSKLTPGDSLILAGFKQPTITNTFPKAVDIINKAKSSDTIIKSSNFLSSLKLAQPVSESSIVKTAPITTTTIKKIKLSTDQLTKIKSSSSPLTTIKTDTETIPKVEPNEAETNFSEKKEMINDEKSDVTTQKEDCLVYSVQRIQDLARQAEPTCFETLLRRLLFKCPLIDSATSIYEYYSWPYGKRKAWEWMRAVRLREMCKAEKFTSQLWKTKQIVLWLRAHGYTPLEYKNIMECEDRFGNENDNSSRSDFSYVNSYSSISRIFDYKRCRVSRSDDYDESQMLVDLDVVNTTENQDRCDLKPIELVKQMEKQKNTFENPLGLHKMTEGEKFIQEELLKVSFKKVF